MRKQSAVTAALAGLVLLLAGCSTSGDHKLKSEWSASEMAKTRKGEVVVVALNHNSDRVMIEDAVVARLKKDGVKAVPSHRSWKNLRNSEFGEFKAWVGSHDVGSIVTIETALVEVASEQDHAMLMTNADFSEVIEASWTTGEVDDDFIVQTTMWDAATWNPIWSGRSDSISITMIGPESVATYATKTLVEGPL